MAYGPSTNFGSNAKSEPSGKGGGGTFASKAGTAGAKSEPGSKLGGGSITTKGNAKKL